MATDHGQRPGEDRRSASAESRPRPRCGALCTRCRYYGVLDPFYPKKHGRNVVAVLEPAGEVKRQIVVSGHHDSARIFNFYVDRPELFSRRVNRGIGSFALLWIASLACAIAGPPQAARIVLSALFLLAFALVAPLWNFASRDRTPGAGPRRRRSYR